VEEKCKAVDLKYEAILPISAKTGDGVDLLEQKLIAYLPESPFMFPKDQITDRGERFLASELIREQLMRFLGEEVPHCTTVEIEKFELKKGKKTVLHISGLIWVEREGQKKIILGSKGEGLKNIATLARKNLEQAFGQQVFLQLWIKVKKGWLDDLGALKSLGYGD
jgi:GTP-binding protein Era